MKLGSRRGFGGDEGAHGRVRAVAGDECLPDILQPKLAFCIEVVRRPQPRSIRDPRYRRETKVGRQGYIEMRVVFRCQLSILNFPADCIPRVAFPGFIRGIHGEFLCHRRIFLGYQEATYAFPKTMDIIVATVACVALEYIVIRSACLCSRMI